MFAQARRQTKPPRSTRIGQVPLFSTQLTPARGFPAGFPAATFANSQELPHQRQSPTASASRCATAAAAAAAAAAASNGRPAREVLTVTVAVTQALFAALCHERSHVCGYCREWSRQLALCPHPASPGRARPEASGASHRPVRGRGRSVRPVRTGPKHRSGGVFGAPGPMVGHCSGALGLDVLGERESFSVHRLMPLPESPAQVLDGVHAAVAGPTTRSVNFAAWLATTLGMQPTAVVDQHCVASHAAASVASNLTMPLLQLTDELANAAAGISRQAFASLISQAVTTWAAHGADSALTRPVTRG
ncbi:DUF2520 domain-containing protein [Streptomyces sp. NPDC048527]|uniref:DUF2520 domain-containing protein n=1 Tax=Streptomyces sp. NPDC048527 TaxID=3365568 RepID=UPI00371027B5